MDSNLYSGIQVIGTQRSGTNLLRLILNQFDEISAPHPPHLLKTFLPLLHNYGNLKYDQNFRILVNDVIEWIEANPIPWNVNLTEERLMKCPKRDLYYLVEYIYNIKKDFDNAQVWCCKSTFNVHYFSSFENRGIKPFYIHLFRDGRDVAVSFKKAPVGPKHIFYIASQWEKDQIAAFKIREAVGDERFISLKYEDLIHEPKHVLSKLCERLRLNFDEGVLDYYHSKESMLTANAGKMWENLKKPILSNNSGKYKNELSLDEIELFEKIAGRTLLKLGYEINNDNLEQKDTFANEELNLFKEINEIMKDSVLKSLSKDEMNTHSFRSNLIKKFTQRVPASII